MPSNLNMNKNRHNRPYERPGTSSNNGENNTNSKGLFNHMKNSVSELFSQSWMPNFLRNDTPTISSTQATERGSANDSFVSTAGTSTNRQLTQIYPEEGNSPHPSTSNSERPLMAFKLNNLEKYKPNLLADPLVASTPSSSNFVDRAVGTLDNSGTNANVSIITPSISYQLDMSEASTSQTPVQNISNRSTLTSKKRLRESFNDSSMQWSNSSFQNKSLPQASALSSKRPRFNTSTYGTPVNTSGALADSSFSIFYPGKTMYGGAANYRKSRCFTPLKSLQRAQVRTQPPPTDQTGEAVLSVAAKRILDCLESMTTPLSEAKKMPVQKSKLDYFDQPYVSDFHKHRPSLRTESPRTPPVSSLVTPSQTKIKGNLASFLKKQGTLTSPPTAPFTVAEKSPSSTTPSTSYLPGTSSGMVNHLAAPVQSIFNMQSSKPLEQTSKPMIRKVMKSQESFKITSKKGVPQFDDSPVEVPDLPNISLPLASMPIISFDSGVSFKPKPSPPPMAKELKGAFSPTTTGNFKASPGRVDSKFLFAVPEVLRQRDKSPVASDSVADAAAFVFRRPHSEKDTVALFPVAVTTTASKPALSSTSGSGDPSIISNGGITSGLSNGWGDVFKPATDSWECGTCCVRNKSVDDKCVACRTVNAKVASGGGGGVFASKPPPMAFTFCGNNNNINKTAVQPAEGSGVVQPDAVPKEAPVAPEVNGFGTMFGKKAGQWTCDACLVDNGKECDSCVACMTAKPGSNPAAVTSAFGGQFAVPQGDWECDVCLVRNKEALKKCLACGSQNPAAKIIDPAGEQVATGFTFGAPAKNDSSGFNFPAGKAAGAASTGCNFSFGVDSTAAEVSSPSTCGKDAFTFGTTVATGAFTCGTTNTDMPVGAVFSFGADSGDKGSKLATLSGTGAAALKFGCSNSTTNVSFGSGSATAAVSEKKPANSDFKFGSDSSQSASELGNDLKASEPSGAKPFSFGSTFGSDKLLFGSKVDALPAVAADSVLAKGIAGEPAAPSAPKLLSGFDLGTASGTDTKLPFDLFKKPPPAYTTKPSQPAETTLSFGAQKVVDLPTAGGSERPFSSVENTTVNKSNLFSFGAPNKSAGSNGDFSFNPTPKGSETSSFPSGLDLFSNKSSVSGLLAGSAEKSLFTTTPEAAVSNSLKRPLSELESDPPANKSSLFSLGTPKNMFAAGTGSSFLSNVKAVPEAAAPASGIFAFGDSAAKTGPPSAYSFGGQEKNNNNNSMFTFGADASTKSESNNNKTGFNFGPTEAPPAPAGLNFSFGGPAKQLAKPAAENVSTMSGATSLFTFGGSNSMPEAKSAMSFGQPANEPSAKLSNNAFSFGNAAEAFKQSQPNFSIGTPNGDSSSMSGFGGAPTNPFSTTGSSVGPTKSSSRIIKKAVRRTRK